MASLSHSEFFASHFIYYHDTLTYNTQSLALLHVGGNTGQAMEKMFYPYEPGVLGVPGERRCVCARPKALNDDCGAGLATVERRV
jgi:hypothetical protein